MEPIEWKRLQIPDLKDSVFRQSRHENSYDVFDEIIPEYNMYDVSFTVKGFEKLWRELIKVESCGSESELTFDEGYTNLYNNELCAGRFTCSETRSYSSSTDSKPLVIIISGLSSPYLQNLTKQQTISLTSLLMDVTLEENQSLNNAQGYCDLFEYQCYIYRKHIMWLHVNKSTIILRAICMGPLTSASEPLHFEFEKVDSILLHGKPCSGKTYEIKNLIFEHNFLNTIYVRVSALDSNDCEDMKKIITNGDQKDGLIEFLLKFPLFNLAEKHVNVKKFYEEIFDKKYENKILICFDGIDLLPPEMEQYFLRIYDYLKKLKVKILMTSRKIREFKGIKYIEKILQEEECKKYFDWDLKICKHSTLSRNLTLVPVTENLNKSWNSLKSENERVTPSSLRWTIISQYEELVKKGEHQSEVFSPNWQVEVMSKLKFLFGVANNDIFEYLKHDVLKKITGGAPLKPTKKFCGRISDSAIESLIVEYLLESLSFKREMDAKHEALWTSVLLESRYLFVVSLLDDNSKGLEAIDPSHLKLKFKDIKKIANLLIENNKFNIINLFSKMFAENDKDLKFSEKIINAHKKEKEKVQGLISHSGLYLLKIQAERKYNSLFHLAIKKHDIELLEYLCDMFPHEMNVTDPYNNTILHSAVIEYYKEKNEQLILIMEKILKSNKEMVNKQNQNGDTALNIAARQGKMDIVEILVNRYNADFNLTNSNKINPFLSAAISGNKETLKYIDSKVHPTESKIDIDLINKAIYYAAGCDNLGIVELLRNKTKMEKTPLFYCDKLDERTPSIFHVSASRGSFKIIKEIINQQFESHMFKKNQYGYTPFHLAIKNVQEDIIKIFLDKIDKLEINKLLSEKNIFGLSPVHSAVNCSQNYDFGDVFKRLKNYEIDYPNFITVNGENLLSFCMRQDILFSSIQTDLIKNSDYTKITTNGFTIFHFAAFRNDVELIENILKEVKPTVDDLRIKSENGYTPLYIAVYRGHLNTFKCLSVHMGKDDYLDGDKRSITPLHMACFNNQTLIFNEMMKSITDKHPTTSQGWTPLYFSVYAGAFEMVKDLFDKYNAKLVDSEGKYLTDRNGFTVLHLAAFQGKYEIVKLLLRNSQFDFLNQLTEFNSTALNLAAQKGHKDIVEYLVVKGADPKLYDKRRFSPIISAAFEGKLAIVKYLLDQDCYKNDKSSFLELKSQILFLLIKSSTRNKDYDRLLNDLITSCIEYKEIELKEYFFYAAQIGNKKILELLLAHREIKIDDKDQNGRTALYLAAENNKIDILSLLYENKANDNVNQNTGWKPIHIAAYNGHIPSVTTILKHNENAITYKTDQGDYPIHLAAWGAHLDLTIYLLNKNAKYLKKENDFGITPFDFALSKEIAQSNKQGLSAQLFQLFENNGFRLNILNDEIDKIECYAAKNDFSMVEYLVSVLKADFEVRNGINTWKPVHYAAEEGNIPTLKYLAKYAKVDLDAVILGKDEKTKLNETSLYVATRKQNLNTVKALVELGADLTIGDSNGWTPLHAATFWDFAEIVDYLCSLDHKYIYLGREHKYINIGSKLNLTALYVGVEYGKSKSLNRLMFHGADPTLEDTADIKYNPLKVAKYMLSKITNENKKKAYLPIYNNINFYTKNWQIINPNSNKVISK